MNPLKCWQHRLLYVTASLLTLSGAVWLTVHYLWGAGADQLPHALEPWLMRLHGGAAFAALFMTGILATSHIPQGWRMTTPSSQRRVRKAGQRGTGLLMSVLGGFTIVSAYLLYYFAPENLRPLIGWAHALMGLLLCVTLPLHSRGKRSSRPS